MERAEALARLEGSPVAHLATTRPDGSPHVIPVTFALVADRIVHMVDHKPKSTRRLQRLMNIEANPRASVLVDHYNDDWARLWWVRVDGPARVVEEGMEWESARASLSAKYHHYQDRPPQGPAVFIAVDKVTGWVGSG
ncbi:MAG TPA: TIGR03668 family PPOX class F420-dependent oxidoreductase [Acidimicrobiia bacterium]|nr:TIGR03668 family PPOX class F420-dependent oxidoreductase [Acidimicrobiia bacterium]